MPFRVPAASLSFGCVSFEWQSENCHGQAVGGDELFEEYDREDGQTLLLLVDAVGHGEEARALVNLLAAQLPAAQNLSPAELLTRLHGNLAPVWAETYEFIVALAVLLDTKARLQWSSAGIPYPLAFIPGAAPVSWKPPGGVPVGMGVPFAATFPQGRQSLAQGQALLVFTDGITEQPDASSIKNGTPVIQYGSAALGRFLAGLHPGSTCHQIVAGLLDDIKSYGGPSWPHDDSTLYCLLR